WTAFASFVDLELAGASPAGTGFTGVAGAVVGAPDVGSPSASDPSGGTPGPRKVCSTEGTGVNVASEPATIEGTTTAVSGARRRELSGAGAEGSVASGSASSFTSGSGAGADGAAAGPDSRS